MTEKRNAYKLRWEILKEKERLVNLDVDGRIILQEILGRTLKRQGQQQSRCLAKMGGYTYTRRVPLFQLSGIRVDTQTHTLR
jgi:hypothetical protein